MSQLPGNIVFFDGVCNLCNRAVQFILKRDKTALFHFASLQSDFAIRLLDDHREIPPGTDSIVYMQGDRLYFKSEAILKILYKLGGIWKLSKVFEILPGSLSDRLYDLIARKRYRWFGIKESCTLSDPDYPERFIK